MRATRHVAATAGVFLFLLADTGEHGQASETPSAARCVCDSSATPGPRSSHQLIYHRQLRRVILLDGYLWPSASPPPNQAELTEVWAWDGHLWTPLPGVGPASRYVSAATFDSHRKRLISYGGRVGPQETVTNETWEWSAGAWTELPANQMEARDHHSMAYDEGRRITVMFGGGTWPRPAGAWPTDTWGWDGGTWRRLAADGPTGRVSKMVYDSKRKQVILFGGVGRSPGPGLPQPLYNDTWAWDGQRWQQVSASGPPARQGHSLAFDRRAGVVVMYGGSARGQQFDDMWQWDGANWTQIRLTGLTPGKRATSMAYDEARHRVVLYGGARLTENKLEHLADTWEWNGKLWKEIK